MNIFFDFSSAAHDTVSPYDFFQNVVHYGPTVAGEVTDSGQAWPDSTVFRLRPPPPPFQQGKDFLGRVGKCKITNCLRVARYQVQTGTDYTVPDMPNIHSTWTTSFWTLIGSI